MACCLGLNKGIHTVIIAMTGINDVLAIFFFTVLCGIVFSNGNLTHQLLQGPVGIVMGCVFGGISGLLVLKLPSDESVCRTLFSSWNSFNLNVQKASLIRLRIGTFCCLFSQRMKKKNSFLEMLRKHFLRWLKIYRFFPHFSSCLGRNILMDSVLRQLFSVGLFRLWVANILSIHRRALSVASQPPSLLERGGDDERRRIHRSTVMWRCTWIFYGSFWNQYRSA